MSDLKSTLTETLRAHQPDNSGFNCTGCNWEPTNPSVTDDAEFAAHQVDLLLGLSGVAVTALPEPATEDVDDDERPKQAGDYLKRGDTRSEVWIEGLPGSEPYVFFGRRGMGPSYMPAEYAQDVAAALLAASRAVVSEGETR